MKMGQSDKAILLNLFFGLLLWQSVRFVGGARELPYTESERVDEYHKRGRGWPITEFVPNTEGWTRLMKRRLSQVQAIEDHSQKFNGFVSTLGPALTLPNFTEYGWGLTQAPQELTNEVRHALYEGLPDARSEGDLLAVGGQPPLFIDRWELMDRVSLHYPTFSSIKG
jgi:hypothetical protein